MKKKVTFLTLTFICGFLRDQKKNPMVIAQVGVQCLTHTSTRHVSVKVFEPLTLMFQETLVHPAAATAAAKVPLCLCI